jgi:flagellum-specific peptidoglycan hydrolase FlgJ
VAASNFDSFFAKGWAPTWQMMGHGNWATDPNYASKVIGVYNRMVGAAKGA